jgi:hypothetical protein
MSRKPIVSGHEGQIVTSRDYTFRIVNGVRVWLSQVPRETMRDIITDPYAK